MLKRAGRQWAERNTAAAIAMMADAGDVSVSMLAHVRAWEEKIGRPLYPYDVDGATVRTFYT